MRKCLVLLAASFLLTGRSFAQAKPEEPEAYTPFDGCTDIYYGVGVPQSFTKAFECFQEADDDIWLILMTLNGEGTPQSIKKARELLDRAQKKPEWRESQWLKAAEAAIEEREKDPAALKTKIIICGWAAPTNNFEVCNADLRAVLEAKDDAELKLVEAKLSAPARASLDEIKAIFEEFQKADGMWMYMEHIDGTSRGVDAQFQMTVDESNFASLIGKIVKNHRLKRRSQQELEAKDKELNSAYRERKARGTAVWDEFLKDPASKDTWGYYRKQRADFLDSAKETQRLWIKLEEPWKKLCQELYRGEMPPEEIDRAIETELREVRIREIQYELEYNPFKPKTP